MLRWTTPNGYRLQHQSETIAVPVIDGTPLFESVEADFPGVPESWVWPPSRQWFDAVTYGEDGRATVLDGACGVADCCGVMARISLLDSVVIWDRFVQGQRSLSSELRFKFDGHQYQSALADFLKAVPDAWVPPPDEY